MPVTLGQLIQRAYEDIAVVQPGGAEFISSTLEQAGFDAANELLGMLSAERYTAFKQVFQTFPLSGNQPAYTLGAGGTWATAGDLRAQRVESWTASYGTFRTGGRVLSFPDFQEQAKDPIGATATLPLLLGADEAWPLIHIRVHPVPSNAPGQVELLYWTPLVEFASTAAEIDLPPGWILALRKNLAVLLYPQNARVGGLPPELAAAAQNAKESLVQQNAPEGAAA